MRQSFAQLADLPVKQGDMRCVKHELQGVPLLTIEPSEPCGSDIVHLHGGGFVFGSSDTHRRLGLELCAATGRVVHLPDYPLAPECAWPSPLEAIVRLVGALSATDGLVLSGDSAGGQLALLAALQQTDDNVSALIVFSPNTLRRHPECISRIRNADTDAMNDPQTDDRLAALVFGQLSATDAHQNPAELDLSSLPPIYIDVGDQEVLLDDSLVLARRAAECGVKHKLHVEPGAFHLRQLFAQHWSAADRSIAHAATWLNDQAT